MRFQPVAKNRFNDPKAFGKFFYAMAILGTEEFPIRVLVQRFQEKEKRVQVQPTTCNTGKSVWIPLDFLLEEIPERIPVKIPA